MATIDFRSVGKTRQQRREETVAVTQIPVGIATPLRHGEDGNFFAVHYDLHSSVADNMRNLILTNWGERVAQYDFGANLRPLLSEFVSLDDFDAKAVERISGAVAKWMPYVSLESFTFNTDHVGNKTANGLAVIVVQIVYSIPALQVISKILEVTLYVM
jgi:phage baseplate assembly protein W